MPVCVLKWVRKNQNAGLGNRTHDWGRRRSFGKGKNSEHWMHLMQQEGEEMSNEVDVDKELWASKGGSQRSLKGKDYFLIHAVSWSGITIAWCRFSVRKSHLLTLEIQKICKLPNIDKYREPHTFTVKINRLLIISRIAIPFLCCSPTLFIFCNKKQISFLSVRFGVRTIRPSP